MPALGWAALEILQPRFSDPAEAREWLERLILIHAWTLRWKEQMSERQARERAASRE